MMRIMKMKYNVAIQERKTNASKTGVIWRKAK